MSARKGPLLSKPCGREGCPRPIESRWAKKLAARKYCSQRCNVTARIAAGWQPQRYQIPREAQIRGAAKGAAVAAARRKKANADRSAAAVAALVPVSVREELDRVKVGYLLAALARAYRAGHAQGYRTAYQHHQRRRRTEGRAA